MVLWNSLDQVAEKGWNFKKSGNCLPELSTLTLISVMQSFKKIEYFDLLKKKPDIYTENLYI